MAKELENDAANPCIGCGPENPLGLKLRFAREGDAVVSELHAAPTLQGWPDRLHSGVLYTAMLETANWTVYGLRGHVGLPVRTTALDLRRWVAVGARLRLEGRAAPSASEAFAVRVTASLLGEPVASLERGYAFPPPGEFAARLGYERMPAVLEDVLPR